MRQIFGEIIKAINSVLPRVFGWCDFHSVVRFDSTEVVFNFRP